MSIYCTYNFIFGLYLLVYTLVQHPFGVVILSLAILNFFFFANTWNARVYVDQVQRIQTLFLFPYNFTVTRTQKTRVNKNDKNEKLRLSNEAIKSVLGTWSTATFRDAVKIKGRGRRQHRMTRGVLVQTHFPRPLDFIVVRSNKREEKSSTAGDV